MEEKVIGRFPKYGFEIVASPFYALEEIGLDRKFEIADEMWVKIRELTAFAEKKIAAVRMTRSKFEKLIVDTKKKLTAAKRAQVRSEKSLAALEEKIARAREKVKAAISEDELDAVGTEFKKISVAIKKLVANLKKKTDEKAVIQAKLEKLTAAAAEADAAAAAMEKSMSVFEGFDLTDPSDWERIIKFALRRGVKKLLKDRGDVKIVFAES